MVIMSLILSSCGSRIYKEAYPVLGDGKYDSEFPYKNSSVQLEQISESIKNLNCVAYYKSYILSEDSHIRKQDLSRISLEKVAVKVEYMDNSTSGTATVIYFDGTKVAVLTCAHVVQREDTVLSYYYDSNGWITPYLQSVTVLERQSNYIPDFPEGGEMEILKMDIAHDIAVLGKKFKQIEVGKVKVFDYPCGSAKELEWGDFVYLFGYPMGFKTLTKALVSSPNKDKTGAFILDAVFNKGFSGGIVLAVRDGVPNFEFVGMIKAVYADNEYMLKPSKEYINAQLNPFLPYSGEIFVEKKTNLKYGITKAIPVESVKLFFIESQHAFMESGYDFSRFLGNGQKAEK